MNKRLLDSWMHIGYLIDMKSAAEDPFETPKINFQLIFILNLLVSSK